MLPAAQRLRHRRDFDTAVRRGRRAGRRTLVVHAALSASGEPGEVEVPARVGLIVSKAVGSAVVRNTVKRRLRAAARQRLGSLPDGALVVVRANPAAATAPAASLWADLDAALARALAGTPRRGGGGTP